MITELIKALKAGEELKNAETWKNVQVTAGLVTSILAAAIMGLKLVGVDLHATPEEITYIAGGVAGVLGLFNSYTTIATSKRVGVQTGNTSSVESTPNT